MTIEVIIVLAATAINLGALAINWFTERRHKTETVATIATSVVAQYVELLRTYREEVTRWKEKYAAKEQSLVECEERYARLARKLTNNI